MSQRLTLRARRQHITQKIKIAGQRTLSISVHDDEHPSEIFLRIKGAGYSSELIGLYDVIARQMSLAFQHGASPGSRSWAISSQAPQCVAAASICKLVSGNFHEENR